MSFRVLKSYSQNTEARLELERRGISYWPHRTTGQPSFEVGELNKSWDIYESLKLLEEKKLQNETIVDLGAFASEILCVLHRAGFQKLTGIDLNPQVLQMPFSKSIHWKVGDMNSTGFASESVSSAIAISSIEHGYSPEKLLKEVARILKPAGLFIGSTDYWREKIDTSGIPMFGMDWKIFSEPEILSFFEMAKSFGLFPLGALEFECEEDPIDCANRLYTFGWFALIKKS